MKNTTDQSIRFPMDTILISTFTASLFALLNPLGILPIFISYTAKEKRSVQRWLALFLTLTVWALLMFFLLTGGALLKFFGITLDSFRIAGGILLLIIGIGLVNGNDRKAIQDIAANAQNSDLLEAGLVYRKIVVPLAMPLLVGPGAIANVILYGSATQNKKEWELFGGLIAAITAICCLVFAILLIGRSLQRIVGDVGLSIATRILGLLIAAIGVQFITTGLANFIILTITPAILKR
jgi:multiple antibiotic resistance protein